MYPFVDLRQQARASRIFEVRLLREHALFMVPINGEQRILRPEVHLTTFTELIPSTWIG